MLGQMEWVGTEGFYTQDAVLILAGNKARDCPSCVIFCYAKTIL